MVPRIALISNVAIVELHGLSDSSDRAYGAAVYLFSTNSHEQMISGLLCNMSRVAPLKAFTILRLELSAALLLARLVCKIVCVLQVQFDHMYLWSVSTIV